MAAIKPNSTEARFKVGRQVAKGTAQDEDLICGMMTQHGLNIAWDLIDKGGEHGCTGISTSRATVLKSPQRRSSYIVNGAFAGILYPRLIGLLLLGAGFEVATVADGGGNFWTHTFTLADRADLSWLTFLSLIGDQERRATDGRVSELVIASGPTGIRYNGNLRALVEDDPTGLETFTSEQLDEFLPTIGSITVNYDPDGTPASMFSTLEQATLTIRNPFDEAQQSLFNFGRTDLPQNGLTAMARFEGLYMDYDNYERIQRAGVGNTSPSEEAAIASVEYTYQTAAEIEPGQPYEITTTIPHAQISLSDFQASGTDIVEWAFDAEMIDDVAEPITITLINDVATYAATV